MKKQLQGDPALTLRVCARACVRVQYLTHALSAAKCRGGSISLIATFYRPFSLQSPLRSEHPQNTLKGAFMGAARLSVYHVWGFKK